MAFNLAFNEFGDVLTTDDGALAEVTPVESEMSRFQMFFDTPVGSYFYDGNFGNNELDVLGKVDLNTSNLITFKDELLEHMAASNLLAEFDVNVDYLAKDTLTITMEGAGNTNADEIITWNYLTRTGRLSQVENATPVKEYSFMIHSHTWKSTGDVTYNIASVIAKAKEINGISGIEDAVWKHRLYVDGETIETPGRLTTDYEFNDIAETITLYMPVIVDKYIRIELWPSNKAALEATTNPYLMRKIT
tara:strand:- start:832 stop:1575 length:744 start_codon:yes stop_codon:yes gene_type:complete